MKSYYITKTREAEKSLLSIREKNELFNYSLLHSSITEIYAREAGEFGKGHSHNVYHLVLYLDGNNDVISQGKKTPVKRGTLLLVSPGEKHDFYPIQKGKIKYAEITFEYLYQEKPLTIGFPQLMEKITNTVFRSVQMELSEEEIQTWLGLFYEYGRLQKDQKKTSFEIQLKLAELWNFIRSLQSNEQDETLADRTEEMIRESLREKLNLNDLSKSLGFSKTYINSEFKKIWHTSPIEYHRNLRLQKAADLLRSGEESLREIALTFGFYDQYHFSRCFQSLYGIPPGEFRKQNRRLQEK